MNSDKMKFYNTLTREKEDFSPINPNEVKMYTCGPTVYNYAHIGNFRAYIFADVLVRSLKYSGYKVNQVMNITDIGHLSSDADSGEDKMTKGLLREGKELNLKNMRALAEFYAEKFKEDAAKLNIELPPNLYFASDYIKEDVELIEKLEKNGYAYKTSDGIYFDTSKKEDYGILWGGKRTSEESESRIGENTEKRHPADFALWKFNNSLGFPSPWGQGFPGWHIECSAMGLKFLGDQFDIHTGGIDHISVHHTNEIAQSEAATGKKPFVRFWMHSDHVDIGEAKMAKSGENFLTVGTLVDKGINPVVYRFWVLMGSYRTKMNFHWEALEAAETALKRLYSLYMSLGNEVGNVNGEYQQKFKEYIGDDLNTPRALSLLWDVIKDENVSDADKKATILDFDTVLSLGFENLKAKKSYILKAGTGTFSVSGKDVDLIYLSEKEKKLANFLKQREEEKKNKNWEKADEIRGATAGLGYEIKDTKAGPEATEI